MGPSYLIIYFKNNGNNMKKEIFLNEDDFKKVMDILVKLEEFYGSEIEDKLGISIRDIFEKELKSMKF